MPSFLSHRLMFAGGFFLLACLAPACAEQAAIDDIALRHYAARGEKARVELEIVRLNKLDPSWRVPDDLWSAAQVNSASDEDDLWDLLDQQGPDAARQAVDARLRLGQDWVPSSTLTQAIERRAMRTRILEGARDKNWAQIAASFDAKPGAIDPRDIEIHWIISEAMLMLGRPSDASAIFRRVIVDEQVSEDDRRATLQKAINLLGMVQAETLIALVADQSSLLQPLLVDLTRARISAILKNL